MYNMEEIEQKLLSYRGNVAHVVPFGMKDISDKMLNEGIYFNNPTVKTLDYYSAGLCHNNSINEWANNIDSLRICTGYAIDGDVWYRHTWCLDKDNLIYECTPHARSAYYGVVLNLQESKEFISDVLYPYELEEIKSKITR